jgi:hypothetical protein
MSKRSFVVVAVNENTVSKTGRYLCSTPAGAAKKAFNELARKKMSKSKSKSKSRSKNKKRSLKMVIKIQETTEGSNKKEYTYRVKRVTLKEPRVVELKNGETITYRYDTIIEKH